MNRQGCVENDRKLTEGEWIGVEPVHCHQRLLKNTLIAKVRYVSADKVSTEAVFRFVPAELEFFFDHEIDHLPGMLGISAMRQLGLVLAHLVYDAPMDFVALLEWINIKLYNYAELNTPTTGRSKLLKFSKSRNRITLVFDASMMQEGFPVMRGIGKLTMLSPGLAAKVRHKKITLEDVERKG